jgi:dienelactone hydrolase
MEILPCYRHHFCWLLCALFLWVACQPAPDSTATSSKTTQSAAVLPTLANQPNDSLSMHTATFPSKDGLTIHARVYHKNTAAPVVLLCHQAGSSKDEYAETAPMIANWGYNCVAIDQRAGGTRLGGNNETATLATQQGKSTEFTDAEQDIVAAIDYVFKMYDKPIILVGSSYSAALTLKLGSENRKLLAVAAFSPGEYFQHDPQYIGKTLPNLKKPTFITSSLEEVPQATALFDLITIEHKMQFKPTTAGIHGARALWQQTPDHEAYQTAFRSFLDSIR